MGMYLVFSNLTDEGRRTIKNAPERILEVNKEIQRMGVTVHEQYALLGQYDFVSIIECLDNESVLRMCTELCSRGTVQMMTIPAIPIADFIKSLK